MLPRRSPGQAIIRADYDELLKLEGIRSSDDTFQPITVELADPRDGSVHSVTSWRERDDSIRDSAAWLGPW